MPRILTAALLLISAAVFLACGGGDDADPTPTATTGAGALASPTASAGANEKPATAPSTAPGQVSVANEAFSVETPDGLVLKGHAYTPDGPKRQALIIVAPVEQSVWAESTKAFTSQGIAVFTFDPRGFGETGGGQDARALPEDSRLLTRFVLSREYPLVYLMGVGLEGGAAVNEVVSTLDEVSGVVTYGSPPASNTPSALALGGDATWNGDDVLSIPAVQERVVAFVLRN